MANNTALEKLLRRTLDQDDRKPLSDEEIATLMTSTSADVDGLPIDEREALVDRLLADEKAAEKMQALRSLQPWSHKTAEAVIGPSERSGATIRRKSARRPAIGPRTWALAATALLAVGWMALGWSGWMLNLPNTANPNTASDNTRRSAPLQEVTYEPADGARLTVAPEVFRWTLPDSVDTTDEVRMLLFDANTELLWKSPWGRSEEISLPSGLQSELKRGGTFFWRLAIDDGLEERLTFLAQFDIQP